MARTRRGSFGLKPRVAPDVTGTIVALAREYVAKRDSLIMDAWRNGGTFEGKKVTDNMVLGYWKDREKDLDPTDPDFEQAKDQIMQLQYGIAQSKADVLHVQGKLSDTAYAHFFLEWAKKVPGNSEFYRTLQKDAAQLIESAKNKARVNGERAKTEAFNAFVKTTQKRDIAIGEALTAALNDLSKQTQLTIQGNGEELLSLLTQNVRSNPEQYRFLLDAIKAGDPHWNGQLTEGYFTQQIKNATQGYSQIATRAMKDGYMTAYKGATDGEAAMAATAQGTKVWPVAQSYSVAEKAFLQVWNNPSSSQMDKQAAASAFSAKLTDMANTPGLDAGSKTMIEADAARLLGQNAGDSPSFGSSILGRPGVDPKMASDISVLAQTTLAMQSNPLAWAYAPVDKNGQFDPTGNGPIGMVPAGAVPPGAQAVMVPGANGQAVMAMIPSHAVYLRDENNPSASPKLAGHQLSYNVGGRTIELWGYKDARGVVHWSTASPLAEGSTTTTDNKGDVYVTAPQPSLASQVASIPGLNDEQRKVLAAGGSVDTVSNTSSKGVAGQKVTTTISIKGGYVSSTVKTDQIDVNGTVTGSETLPGQITKPEGAYSPSLLSAGEVPGVTFSSPLQASVSASTYTQTQDQINRFGSDPAFQQAFLSQTMQTLGTNNPFDPRIADAWKGVTTATAPQDEHTFAPSSFANNRTDLRYPGIQAKTANQGQIGINFGSVGELKLPSLPSYLQGQNVDLSKLGNAANALFGGGLSNLLPGLGVPQHPAGTPAATVPGVTPTPTPSVATGPKPVNVDPARPVEPPTSPYTPPVTGGGGGGGRKPQ